MLTSFSQSDPEFELFMLNEEETRILLAIQELKQQLIYVNEEQFKIVEVEIQEQIDLYEKNILRQIEIRKFLKTQ
tara:strand:+ start:929 stop:1153 length:225 start_codon:yes stop_codon:yes gene_type:complete